MIISSGKGSEESMGKKRGVCDRDVTTLVVSKRG